MTSRPNSEMLHRRARTILPGGVNSPVRAFRSVGGTPVYFRRGSGQWVEDVDGNRYLDLVGSWGPLITGHADPVIVDAVAKAAADGLTFGACHAAEAEFAEEIRSAVPSMEMLRLVSSGTEAVMGALRVARGCTGRDRVVKFEGCYHGHSDPLLSKAGSGMATFGLPDSAGVPAGIASTVSTVPYNDLHGGTGGRKHGLCCPGARLFGGFAVAVRCLRDRSGLR